MNFFIQFIIFFKIIRTPNMDYNYVENTCFRNIKFVSNIFRNEYKNYIELYEYKIL